MRKLLCQLTLAALTVAASSSSFASEQLAASKNCTGCHSVEKKIVGPAYKDVAAKYAGQKGAADALATRIKAGGTGVWGTVAMPANNVSDDEAKKLAAWVLSLK